MSTNEPTTTTTDDNLATIHRLAANRRTAELLQGVKDSLDALFVQFSAISERWHRELRTVVTGGCRCDTCLEFIDGMVCNLAEADSVTSRLTDVRAVVNRINPELPEVQPEEVEAAINEFRDSEDEEGENGDE